MTAKSICRSVQETDLLLRSTNKPKDIDDSVDTEGPPSAVPFSPFGEGSSGVNPTPNPSGGKKPISYKEACLGINGKGEDPIEDVPLWDKLDGELDWSDEEVELEGEREVGEPDPLCPRVVLSAAERKRICKPWRQSVIIKILGMKVGLRYMTTRLQRMWQPKQHMEVIDLENDYFLARFDCVEDMKWVFDGGPWLIADHYLVIQRWRPQFFPWKDDLRRVAIWIRIPGLPIEYYDNSVLWEIGNKVGKTLKIDRNTRKESEEAKKEFGEMKGSPSPTRGKFARLCVEVDIRKVLVSRVNVEDNNFPVEYEGLHLVCFHCGRYGHKVDACSLLQGVNAAEQGEKYEKGVDKEMLGNLSHAKAKEDFGPWMIVKKNRRPRGNGQNLQGTPDNSSNQQKGAPQPQLNHSPTTTGKFSALSLLANENNNDEGRECSVIIGGGDIDANIVVPNENILKGLQQKGQSKGPKKKATKPGIATGTKESITGHM